MEVLFCPITFLMWMLFSIFVQPVCLKQGVSLHVNILLLLWFSDITLAYLSKWNQGSKLHIDQAISSVRLLRVQFVILPVQVLLKILVAVFFVFHVLSVFLMS